MSARIYTRTGDSGETGLFGGQRVRKNALRVETYGTVDELNALLGIVRLAATRPEESQDGGQTDPELDAILYRIQHDLFALGADLATPEDTELQRGRVSVERIGPERTVRLEHDIDRMESELPALTRFILPGGTPLAAQLHFARTVCRRAERFCVTLAQYETVNPEVLRYMNRLSDLLFVLARAANHRQNVPDVPWVP